MSVMMPKFFAFAVGLVGMAGCGGGDTWVDTTSGSCLESQIEETRQHPELFVEMGTQTCQGKAMGGFAGEFRCAGSAEDGTLRLQVKCEG
jgi:hypothetical protein